MILKQGHKYLPMPHDGKVIRRIYRGGRCYYIATPYSPEATQALKAAFPQYWTAIRYYGWANPALVPFINEDPMLIVSLVEVGKTRWLVGDGKAWINTGIDYSTLQTSVCFYTKFQLYETLSGENDFWGKGEGGTPTTGFSNMTYFSWAVSGSTWNPTTTPATLNDVHTYSMEYKKAGGRVAEVDGKQYSTSTHANQFGGAADKIYFFASAPNRYPIKAMVCNGKLTMDGVLLRDFLPYNNGTECGMLDIVSLTFHPNANTEGTFTIEITDKD